IIHAGDIGSAEILEALKDIAPLTAVRGNNDRGAWTKTMPETARIEVGGRTFYVLHDIEELALDPAQLGIDVVVSGHSHMPRVEEHEGVLFVNPGSAGPRRFKLPISIAVIKISSRAVEARLASLKES